MHYSSPIGQFSSVRSLRTRISTKASRKRSKKRLRLLPKFWSVGKPLSNSACSNSFQARPTV